MKHAFTTFNFYLILRTTFYAFNSVFDLGMTTKLRLRRVLNEKIIPDTISPTYLVESLMKGKYKNILLHEWTSVFPSGISDRQTHLIGVSKTLKAYRGSFWSHRKIIWRRPSWSLQVEKFRYLEEETDRYWKIIWSFACRDLNQNGYKN